MNFFRRKTHLQNREIFIERDIFSREVSSHLEIPESSTTLFNLSSCSAGGLDDCLAVVEQRFLGETPVNKPVITVGDGGTGTPIMTCFHWDTATVT